MSTWSVRVNGPYTLSSRTLGQPVTSSLGITSCLSSSGLPEDRWRFTFAVPAFRQFVMNEQADPNARNYGLHFELLDAAGVLLGTGLFPRGEAYGTLGLPLQPGTYTVVVRSERTGESYTLVAR